MAHCVIEGNNRTASISPNGSCSPNESCSDGNGIIVQDKGRLTMKEVS